MLYDCTIYGDTKTPIMIIALKFLMNWQLILVSSHINLDIQLHFISTN